MIVKLLSQLLLVGTLMQVVPADMSMVEQLATLPEAPTRSFDLLAAHDLVTSRLPDAKNKRVAPVSHRPTSVGVVTSAQSAIVMDRASGEILFEKNVHVPRAIGSITKLMTAHVFLLGNPDLNAPVTLSSQDVRLGASQHLSLSDTYTVRNLLEASLVGSDNTSTAALARLSGLSLGDFVAKMNEEAAVLGMQRTTFADTTGLSSNNRSVVSDIAIMLDRLFENETLREVTQLPSVTITGVSGRSYFVNSTDDLLSTFVNQAPYGIVGAKTGFLPEAGYCLGTVFSHEDGGELIVVVLGSESKQGRFQDVKSLAVWAYDTFTWQSL